MNAILERQASLFMEVLVVGERRLVIVLYCTAVVAAQNVDFIKNSEVAERQVKGLQKGLNRL